MFDDIEFLKDASQWPGNGCLCCVKKRCTTITSLNGHIYADEAGRPIPTVHLSRSAQEYGSIEEMVADGWVVD